MFMKQIILFLAVTITTAFAANAQISNIFVKDGYAIGGYDPVAYFTDNKAVKGTVDNSVTWKNVKWLFSNQQHAAMFKANPEKYSPQYGGYCAYGCTRGYKAKTEPEAFSIISGKLYFNYNAKIREEWLKNVTENIKKADEQLDKLFNTSK